MLNAMVRIKICGITNLEDALLAADLGAHALGFIFYAKSPRCVAPEAAREIIRQLPPLVVSVGVFVDEEAAMVRDLAARVGLDWVQLHGAETPEYCRSLGRRVLKGFRIQDENSLKALPAYRGAVQAFLLDTYKKGQTGGTGETFDWDLARQAQGLRPHRPGRGPDRGQRGPGHKNRAASGGGRGQRRGSRPGEEGPGEAEGFF